jgi:hypothetical protein
VAEHVRQVADAHGAVEVRGPRKPGLEVSQRRLAVDEELVHECLPRPDGEPPLPDEFPDPLRGLGPDLEVVVDGRELAVEREPEPVVRLEPGEDVVDDLDERDPKGLEGPVPLPVPMRVRDEEDQLPGLLGRR